MKKLALTFACADYDRTLALTDGSVQPNGIELNVLQLPPDEIFFRMMNGEEFDMSELSAASYLIAKDKGKPRFTALPVFLSRTFRHSSIYIHRSGKIRTPEELHGMRIGVPEYHITALVWVRGWLQDEYGIQPSEIDWYWGGVDTPRTKPGRVSIELPSDVRLTAIASNQTLNQMLLEGEIDAIISPRPPLAFVQKQGDVIRLFPDYRKAEKEYYEKTGLFPIMHVVAIKDELLERYPWIALSMLEAFLAAKKKAYEKLDQIGSLRVTLPWLAAEVEETKALMGEDFWPYGVKKNEAALQALIRYSHEQGLIRRAPALEELFAKSTFNS